MDKRFFFTTESTPSVNRVTASCSDSLPSHRVFCWGLQGQGRWLLFLFSEMDSYSIKLHFFYSGSPLTTILVLLEQIMYEFSVVVCICFFFVGFDVF